jgi:hypothetical protein
MGRSRLTMVSTRTARGLASATGSSSAGLHALKLNMINSDSPIITGIVFFIDLKNLDPRKLMAS